MGSCCQQSYKPQQQIKSQSLQEKLVQQPDRQQQKEQRKQVQSKSQTVMKKYISIEEKISSPLLQKPKQVRFVNQNIQKMAEMQIAQKKRSFQRSDELPMQSTISVYRSGLKMSDDNIKTNQKSEIWMSESGSKIFYYNYQKEYQIVFTFKINKVKIDDQHPMNYLLHPSQHQSQRSKLRSSELSICLITSPRSMSSFKSVLPLLKIDSHIKPIFGLQRPQTQKLPKSYFESDKIYQIINMGKSTVRMQSIDQIIFSLREQKYYERIQKFCEKVTQQYELCDITKITLILPSFITVSQIGTILSKLLRRHIISQKLQRIIKYLGYQIELVQSTQEQFEEVLIVSSNLSLYEQEQLIHKEFQMKLQLAMGLLMIEVDNNNYKLYEMLMTNFLMDKNIIDYLKFIIFVHRDKKQYARQLEELKLFEEEQLAQIHRSKKMQENQISPCQKSITIPYRNKKRIGELFREYKTTKTPQQQPQKKKQWDDDLKQNDIKATIMQKSNKYLRHHSFQANLFQIINDEQIDKVDLSLMPQQQEQFQFYQN